MKNPEKNMYHNSQINIKQYTNIDNYVTLKTGIMAAEYSAFHHSNKLHFKIHYNRTIILNSNNI